MEEVQAKFTALKEREAEIISFAGYEDDVMEDFRTAFLTLKLDDMMQFLTKCSDEDFAIASCVFSEAAQALGKPFAEGMLKAAEGRALDKYTMDDINDAVFEVTD